MWLDSIDSTTGNIKKLKELYEFPNKFKVGFGTGFAGMTMLPLLISNNELKQKAFNFYKLLNIGKHRNGSSLNINEFPFSRRFDKKEELLDGFGWVTVLNKENENITSSINKMETRPPNTILAEIVDMNSKPPKVKILEGEFEGKETILPGVRLENLALAKGSKIYVELVLQKKTIQKADYKGKAE